MITVARITPFAEAASSAASTTLTGLVTLGLLAAACVAVLPLLAWIDRQAGRWVAEVAELNRQLAAAPRARHGRRGAANRAIDRWVEEDAPREGAA